MNPITLEITIKSADVFKNINCFGKMHLYTTVTLAGSDRNAAECRTNVDEHGGSRPFWWILASFRVDESEIRSNKLMLIFGVKCKKSLGHDKNVGTIYIPIKELFDKSECQSFAYDDVALGINSEMGKPRGVLYLSYFFRINNLVDFSRFYVPSAPPLRHAFDSQQEDRD